MWQCHACLMINLSIGIFRLLADTPASCNLQGLVCSQEDRVPGITSIDGVQAPATSDDDRLICGFQVTVPHASAVPKKFHAMPILLKCMHARQLHQRLMLWEHPRATLMHSCAHLWRCLDSIRVCWAAQSSLGSMGPGIASHRLCGGEDHPVV